MISISFHYRFSSKGADFEGSIFVRIVYERKVISITTPYHIFGYEWDNRRQCIIIPCDCPVKRKLYLYKVQSYLHEQRLFLLSSIGTLEKKKSFSTDSLFKLFNEKKKVHTLISYAKYLATKLKRSDQTRTASSYILIAKMFVDFNNVEDMPLESITKELVTGFENDLKEKGKSLNTISSYMRTLRAIYNKAIKDEQIKPNIADPFEDSKIEIVSSVKYALTEEEIRKIVDLNLTKPKKGLNRDSKENLHMAKLLFLFSFYSCGMLYIDMTYLKKENIKDNIIQYTGRMSKKKHQISLNQELLEIIKYFENITKGSKYVFPIIEEGGGTRYAQYESGLRVQNKRLKQIGILAGINKPVTSNSARYSWAMIAHKIGIPLTSICKGLGHSSEKTTQAFLDSIRTDYNPTFESVDTDEY